ncbi:hypothetical protein SADUNF_Sadunf19G0029300 [Salix dunnii]|uniref:Uncharacterized protein n=1 Tax=Salix dunnii TaxID=1413687 RepID=A0A835IY49_9ROSI|nr:hypothetical protein SADUNF_Sadunf19G0029300 [Salix dunnii]
MTRAKPYQSQCISGTKMSKFDGDPLLDSSRYRHIVIALQYCTLTRPDIAFSATCSMVRHAVSVPSMGLGMVCYEHSMAEHGQACCR